MPSSRRSNARSHTAAHQDAYLAAARHTLAASMANLDLPLSRASIDAVRVANEAAQSDPYGDGDQSLLENPSQHPLRSAWSTGLDFQITVLSEKEAWSMHRSAFELDVEEVLDLIKEARQKVDNGDSEAMTKLLERRISLLRLTPLHYACQVARNLPHETQTISDSVYTVVQALCEAGARVNARDIAGYTPLSSAAGFHTTSASLRLVPLLISHGADPNIRTRFGESMLVPPIMSGNTDAFRELLRAGADVSLPDRSGLTPREMAGYSPTMLKAMTEVEREKAIQGMQCGHCGQNGARKFCSACHKAYYCDRDCQKAAWRVGHRENCGKDTADAQHVDINPATMTSSQPFPGMDIPDLHCVNNITGASSRNHMKPLHYDKAFVVKVCIPLKVDTTMGCIKINVKNSDFLLLSPVGPGRPGHEALRRLVNRNGSELGKVYLSAKWVQNRGNPGSNTESVLRIDTSKVLPPPKPIW